MDYTRQIRAQIQGDIERLVDTLPQVVDSWYIIPRYVTLGYVVNSHHGRPLFNAGDTIDDLPVRISYTNPRAITVHSNHDSIKRSTSW